MLCLNDVSKMLDSLSQTKPILLMKEESCKTKLALLIYNCNRDNIEIKFVFAAYKITNMTLKLSRIPSVVNLVKGNISLTDAVLKIK